jgi:alpha-beta hydrolase superfamily lysophospholipase
MPDNEPSGMQRIQIGDLAVAVSDIGKGPPVVLLHGLACGKRMWFHQIRALKGCFRVIAYDQRGHGLTDAPPAATSFSAGHLARDLVGVLDALQKTARRLSASRWAAARPWRLPPASRSACRVWCLPMSAPAPTIR